MTLVNADIYEILMVLDAVFLMLLLGSAWFVFLYIADDVSQNMSENVLTVFGYDTTLSL